MSIFSQRSTSSNTILKGFTLIELLVVVSLMVIITGALLLRQASFDSATLLRSLAYSVGLSVRQAQVYSTSIFGTTTSQTTCNLGIYENGNCFAPGYGIYVNWGAGNPTTYTLFADFDNNGTYTSNAEIVKVFSLGQGYSISRVCATTAGASPVQFCNGSGLTWMATVYRRPNPEACITSNIQPGVCNITSLNPQYATSSIQVQLTGSSGSTRSVFIFSNGQIAVGNAGS